MMPYGYRIETFSYVSALPKLGSGDQADSYISDDGPRRGAFALDAWGQLAQW